MTGLCKVSFLCLSRLLVKYLVFICQIRVKVMSNAALTFIGNNDVNSTEGRVVQQTNSSKVVMPGAETMADSVKEYRPKIMGIYMPPSVEYIVAVLSVLRCGEAFLPLDPFWPKGRILSIVSSSKVDLIIESQSSFGKSDLDQLDESHWLVHSSSCPILNFSMEENLQECPTDLAWPCANEKQRSFCYLMYTSGSTGKPKGVCGTEQGIQLVQFFNYECHCMLNA